MNVYIYRKKLVGRQKDNYPTTNEAKAVLESRVWSTTTLLCWKNEPVKERMNE